MSNQPLIQFLQSTGLVSQASAVIIADRFNEKTIARNDFLLKAGRVCDEYLFLCNGYMRAFAHDTAGNEITTNFCGPNEVVFEVASFFHRTVSKENIHALTDCEGWVLTHRQLNELFHSMPEFREFGRNVLVRGFSALKTRMLSQITETGEERYAHLLQSNPAVFQQAPLKYIASYLGITDTSLSRIRRDFAKSHPQ